MSAGVQRNDTQQYCTLDNADNISTTTSFVQYSPSNTTSPAWWSSIKSEVVSIKDDWSSDSESSQQNLYGTMDMSCDRDANTENILPVSDGSFSLNNSGEEVPTKKKKGKDGSSSGNKPAQVVERRNARERRRVQAVNGAFQKLRKVVPIEENKSKRMSKVKTLQLAIEYINQLQSQLQFTSQHTNDDLIDLFNDFQHPQHPVKLEPAEFQFATSYYPQLLREDEH